MRALLTLFAIAPPALPALAALLNDTGQTSCYDGSNNPVACSPTVGGDAGTNPRQDARYGRDAANAAGALSKTGGGVAGFDFTKLGADGQPLAIQDQAWTDSGVPNFYDTGSEGAGTKWACVRDNHTGLVWEVKTHANTADLRDKGFFYTWYNSNAGTNGGNAGFADTGAAVGSDNCFNNARCDTEKYVADVNAANICGETIDDWRLPNRKELLSLVHLGTSSPSIDTACFPNTRSNLYWSADTYTYNHPVNAANAWYVGFGDGYVYADGKTNVLYVRLVRGGQ